MSTTSNLPFTHLNAPNYRPHPRMSIKRRPIKSNKIPNPSSLNNRKKRNSKNYALFSPTTLHRRSSKKPISLQNHYKERCMHPFTNTTINKNRPTDIIISWILDAYHQSTNYIKNLSSFTNKDFYIRILFGLLLFSCSIFIYFKYGEYLTFNNLQSNHSQILSYIDKYPYFCPISFTLLICIIVGLCIPGATVLSMASGLLFQQPFASIYAWFGCSSGAILCFLFIRYIFGKECISKCLQTFGISTNGNSKKYEMLADFERGLKENEFLSLIYVRYIIIIPFWLVNISAALMNASFKTFAISTLIATIPGSLLYTTAGRGLAHIFEIRGRDGVTGDLSTWMLLKQVMFNEDMVYCGLLLVLCLMIPMIIKKSQYFKNVKVSDDDDECVESETAVLLNIPSLQKDKYM